MPTRQLWLSIVLLAAVLGGLLAPAAASAASTGRPLITIFGYLARPRTVSVRAGTPVTWRNGDVVDHEIAANDGSFGPLLLPGRTAGPNGETNGDGARISATFAEPGRYDYVCTIHPWITGSVIVRGGKPSSVGCRQPTRVVYVAGTLNPTAPESGILGVSASLCDASGLRHAITIHFSRGLARGGKTTPAVSGRFNWWVDTGDTTITTDVPFASGAATFDARGRWPTLATSPDALLQLAFSDDLTATGADGVAVVFAVRSGSSSRLRTISSTQDWHGLTFNR